MTHPWPRGATTGLGSLPGTDPIEASKLVVDAVQGLPYLPELPDRGLAADMVGRAASLLVDLPVEWQPHGWTMTAAPTRDLRRGQDLLHWDVDAFAEQAAGAGVVKIQVCGPLTLAASLELTNLHKVLSDHGAVADLTASLAEGVARHVADLSARLPGTTIVLQLDEPGLPAVLSGQVPTPSGYGTVRSLDRAKAGAALIEVLDCVPSGQRAVHCCAADVPYELLRMSGAAAIAVDLDLVAAKDLDAIGEAIDGGMSLWLGIVPSTDDRITFDAARNRVESFWQWLGFDRALLADNVVVTPACGLATATPAYARHVMAVLSDVGRSTLD